MKGLDKTFEVNLFPVLITIETPILGARVFIMGPLVGIMRDAQLFSFFLPWSYCCFKSSELVVFGLWSYGLFRVERQFR